MACHDARTFPEGSNRVLRAGTRLITDHPLAYRSVITLDVDMTLLEALAATQNHFVERHFLPTTAIYLIDDLGAVVERLQ